MKVISHEPLSNFEDLTYFIVASLELTANLLTWSELNNFSKIEAVQSAILNK